MVMLEVAATDVSERLMPVPIVSVKLIAFVSALASAAARYSFTTVVEIARTKYVPLRIAGVAVGKAPKGMDVGRAELRRRRRRKDASP